MSESAADDLSLERAWLIECTRCANEASSFASQMHEARGEFAEMGWTSDGWAQFCPACGGAS